MSALAGYLLRSNDFPNGIGTPQDVEKLGNLLNPYLQTLKSLNSGGVNVGANLDAQQVSFQLVTPASDWIDFTPATWTNSGGAYPNFGWRSDALGASWLRGRIATLPALTTVLGTLPAAAAPAFARRFPQDAAGAYGAIEIAASGQITQVVGSIAGTLDFACSFPSVLGAPGVLSCFPQQIRIQDKRKPMAVILLSVQDHSQANPSNTPNSGTTTPAILAPGVQWSYLAASAGPNLLSLDGIPGLALGRTYDVSILVLFS